MTRGRCRRWPGFWPSDLAVKNPLMAPVFGKLSEVIGLLVGRVSKEQL